MWRLGRSLYRGHVSKWGGLDSPPHYVHVLSTSQVIPQTGISFQTRQENFGLYCICLSPFFALPRSGLSQRVGGRGGALLRHEVQSRTGGNRRQVPPHQAREAASLCGAPQSLRRASAVGERHRCSRKGSATARQIFLGHHSSKYFLTAGHPRCLAGLLLWTISVDGEEGREEGDETRRAPLPLGAWHVVSAVSAVSAVYAVYAVQYRMVIRCFW